MVTESDCNTLINGSWIIQNPLNGPGEGWWLIQSFGDNNTRKQIGYDLHNSQPPKTRRFAAGTANVWENLKDDFDKIISKTGVLNPNGSKFTLSIDGINGDLCPIIQLMDSPQTVIRTHCPATGILEVTLSGEVTYSIRYILWYKKK